MNGLFQVTQCRKTIGKGARFGTLTDGTFFVALGDLSLDVGGGRGAREAFDVDATYNNAVSNGDKG